MTRKKIVLVVVEGPSDDIALGIALNQIFDKNVVHIHIMHGDITTRKGINSQNIVSKLGDVIKKYANSQHYKAKDFKQIIHIIDTDGAYIDDSNIFEDSSLDKVVYESDGIYTANIDSIIKRNLIKRENVYRLRTQSSIWNVPYKIYYMACNLDHVLYDKRNSTDDEKENDAYAFAKKYRRDKDGFVKYMCESDFSVNGDFKTSWQYIEKDLHSLERYSNLCICIKEELDKQEEKKNECKE